MKTRIMEHLKKVLPPEVVFTWIDNFVIEKCENNEILIVYYGNEPLSKFKKEYQETVYSHICFVAGYENKIKIKQRKVKGEKSHKEKKEKKQGRGSVIKWFILSFIFIAIAFSIALIIGNYIADRTFKETFYNVSSLKANNTMRVIQISDLHSCEYGENNEDLIDRVTKLKPDIIIYTGDCLDSKATSCTNVVDLCETLAKVAPSYYVYGNNEVERYYKFPLNQTELDAEFGFDDKNRDPSKLTEITDDLEKDLEAAGVKVLKNEQDTVVVGTTNVDVFGVLTSNPSSFWSYAGDEYNKFLYENTENLKITAIHEPAIFTEFEVETWGDLAICGHTHGGTARLPLFGALYTHEEGFLPERKGYYVFGRYEVAGRPLIVNSGLVNNNLLRINNKPEIVIIDINRF